MRNAFIYAAASLALVLGGCEQAGEREIAGVDAQGTARGTVYVDRDGDGVPGSLDALAPNVRVTLTRPGGLRPAASGVTDARGSFRIAGLPVGSYQVGIDPTALGDSLQLMHVDSARVTVAVFDTTTRVVMLGIRAASVAAARAEPLGKVLGIVAVALSGSGAFGDSTFHIADSTGAMRVTQIVSGGIEPGDSLRVVGRTATRHGQAVLAGGTVFRLGKTSAPAPVSLSTQRTSRADGGRLDAGLVKTSGSLISVDASTPDLRLTINDGSGPLEVFLDRLARITPEAPLQPGVHIEASGVLAPLADGSGRWRLKPRGPQDLKATVPETTIEGARAQARGLVVSFTGVAQNSWAALGDSTVHVADPTGAIRAIRVAPVFLFAGDSVRVTGIVGSVGAQPVIQSASITILGKAREPSPSSVGTGAAANANEGRLDAALVRVRGTVRDSSIVSGGSVNFTIDDGSGVLSVLIDLRTGIGTGPWRAGAELGITGVLIPRSDGRSWVLKPRARDDITQ